MRLHNDVLLYCRKMILQLLQGEISKFFVIIQIFSQNYMENKNK